MRALRSVQPMRTTRAVCVSVVLGFAIAGASGAPGGPPATKPGPSRLAMRKAPPVHGGFVDDMDCSACHTTEGWRLASSAGASGFDHDRTGFPLRGAHLHNQCTDCHAGAAKPRASCDGCHRDPHAGRHDGTCAECHTAVAWSDTRVLDDHRRTRMPLTGRHAGLDCSACHRRAGERMFSDTPSDCYACHRADYHAVDSHPVHDGSSGGVVFSRTCSACHRTSAWTPAVLGPDIQLRGARTDHDARFALSTGSHRAAACTACHPDERRARLVRCDGCHPSAALRAQHRTPVARSAAACLGCHPRGARGARGARGPGLARQVAP